MDPAMWIGWSKHTAITRWGVSTSQVIKVMEPAHQGPQRAEHLEINDGTGVTRFCAVVHVIFIRNLVTICVKDCGTLNWPS